MSRTLSLLTTILASLLFVAFAACGGDEEETTQAPTTPTGATPTQPAAVGTVTSDSATATVKVGDQTFTFENGQCETGDDDAWLTVTIGQPGGDQYFGLVVGAHPTAPEGTRSAKGGGVFAGSEVSIVVTHGGSTFAVGGGRGDKVALDRQFQKGEFIGTTSDGDAISGSFTC